MTKEKDEMLSLPKAAALVGVATDTLRKAAQKRALPAIKADAGNAWVVRRSDVLYWHKNVYRKTVGRPKKPNP